VFYEASGQSYIITFLENLKDHSSRKYSLQTACYVQYFSNGDSFECVLRGQEKNYIIAFLEIPMLEFRAQINVLENIIF
jgi:hypothetical protein